MKIRNFIITVITSFLCFEGIEKLVQIFFGIDFGNILAFGGVGTIILLGFKFHIFCCILPMAISTWICTRTSHKHCKHKHEENE